MNSTKRINYIMLGVNALLVVLIISVVFLGDKALQKHSDELINNKLEVALLQSQQEELVQARGDIDNYSELSEIVNQVVPQDKDPAVTTREIIQLAKKAGVSIGSISFPSSNLGSTVKKSAEAITQAEPVKGTTGLYTLAVTVVSDNAKPSSYAQLIDFLENLENNRRTAQVSQINIQPDQTNSSELTFTLTLTVYLKP
jgi:hypothetical protein